MARTAPSPAQGMGAKTQEVRWYLFPDYQLFRQLKYTAIPLPGICHPASHSKDSRRTVLHCCRIMTMIFYTFRFQSAHTAPLARQ
jgi:hypothetical protein